MTIEIRQPEVEALIQERLASGAFQDVEAVLEYALKKSPPPQIAGSRPLESMTLRKVFEAAEGLGEGMNFSRNPSGGRPVEL